MNTTGRLIPYMRKSSGEDPEGSLARQRGAIRAWAETNGIELAPEVWEPHVSGKKPWRERGLGEAIDRVAAGEAAGIIVEEQSRLSRENMKATAEVWDALESADARLVCAAEGIDTASGDHELRFAIQAALAREQWKQYARRMADMKRRKIEAGIFIGPAPTGYRKAADRTLEPDPDVAPIVRALFELRASGASWGDLLKVMDEHTGRTWTQQGIAGIIRNRVYLGDLVYGDLVNEGAHEAVVDSPLWLAAQRRGKAPARSGPKSDRWLLSGLLVCGTCGHSMVVWRGAARRNGREQKLHRRYRCTNRSCTARPSVRAPEIEEWTVSTLWQLLGSRIRESSRARDLGPLVEDIERTKRRLEQVQTPESMDALGDDWPANVKARRLEHEAALTALGEARQSEGRRDDDAIVDLRDRWDDMTPAEQREALRLYAIEYVEVRGPKPSDWLLGLR
jgi:DNA invertase Pin-like site-specific DNA recombinase